MEDKDNSWGRFKRLTPGQKFQAILAGVITLILVILVFGLAVEFFPQQDLTPSPVPSVTGTPTIVYPTFPLTITPATITPTLTFDPLHPYAPTQVSPTVTRTATTTPTKTSTWVLTNFPSATLKPWLTWTLTPTITRTRTVTRTATITRTMTQTPTHTNTSTPRPERIAFTADQNGDGNTGIYTINPDGTSLVTVVQETENAKFWDWSPDARWMVIQQQDQLYQMRPDGTDWTLIQTLATNLDADAVWSPDGSYIVFREEIEGKVDLFRIATDGSNLIQLTDGVEIESDPTIPPNRSGVVYVLRGMAQVGQDGLFIKSPDFSLSVQVIPGQFESPDFQADGYKMVVSIYKDSIWVIQTGAFGASEIFTDLTTENNSISPAWSRDYSQIIFISDRNRSRELTLMSANGTNMVTIVGAPSNPQHPRWMP
jgi:hypothetical protein